VQERRVLLDVAEQRERDELGYRVAPERAFRVDQGAHPVSVDQDVAVPQVEVHKHRSGHLVEHRRLAGEQGPDVRGRPGQRDRVSARVRQHRVHHAEERIPPVLPQRAERQGRVAEPGPGDRVQTGYLAAKFGAQFVAFGTGGPWCQLRPRGTRAVRHHQAGVVDEDHRGHRDPLAPAGQPVVQRLGPGQPVLVAQQPDGRTGRELHHQLSAVGQAHQLDVVERPARERTAIRHLFPAHPGFRQDRGQHFHGGNHNVMAGGVR
jgi:hypothetical protein